jgi:hypothetical protein
VIRIEERAKLGALGFAQRRLVGAAVGASPA